MVKLRADQVSLMAVFAVLLACGGGGGGAATTGGTDGSTGGSGSQAVLPATATRYLNQPVTFLAQGFSPGGVNWTVTSGAMVANSTDSSITIVPTSVGVVNVTGTNRTLATETARATLNATPLIQVSISPQPTTAVAGSEVVFGATTLYALNPGVAWSVTGATLVSSNSTQARVRFGLNGTTARLTATSLDDPTRSQTLSIVVGASTGDAGGTIR